MSLDKATVARIAMLARIEVPEAQQERLAGELSQIMGWIEQLGEVDTARRRAHALGDAAAGSTGAPTRSPTAGARTPILRNAPSFS